MKAVLYLRYSSDRQTEQSIEGQRRVCLDYCQRQGIDVFGEYVDRATSASKDTAKRTEFLKMIDDSQKHKWQAVVVYKLDRFSRDRYDMAVYKKRLKHNGVKVVSATENIGDSPESVILESVLEGMSEFYSKELSQKVKRGMHESALKCKSNGGTIPYGYKSVNKQLVVAEDEAQVVREVFEMFLQGFGVAKIARTLNERGLRTHSNTPFSDTTFKRMLTNRKYLGEYRYGDVVIADGIPRIIDDKTFELVQHKLSSHNGVKRMQPDYLLTGKLFCQCGRHMTGMSAFNHKHKRYCYYTCSCGMSVRQDVIETAVFNEAVKRLNPETIDELAEMTVSAIEKDLKENTTLKSLKRKKADCERGINNLTKALEMTSSPSVIARLNELEKQRKEIDCQIMYEESLSVNLTKPQVVFFLQQFTAGNVDDETFKRRLLELLVSEVHVRKGEDVEYEVVFSMYIRNTPEKVRECTSWCANGRLTRTLTADRYGLHVYFTI